MSEELHVKKQNKYSPLKKIAINKKQTVNNDLALYVNADKTGSINQNRTNNLFTIKIFKIMKTKYYFLAALAGLTFASCSDDAFVGDNSPNVVQNESAENAIQFAFNMQNTTRADIAGPDAAKILGNNFYVMGTKGTESDYYPTASLVFDNYLVTYKANTAGTSESNSANWEYVGVTPGTDPYDDYAYLTSLTPERAEGQTIKYWDYSTTQYDFFAFSTGTYKAGADGNESTKTIGVTAMKYGADLNVETPPVPTAYTFDIPSVTALENAYITDITEVMKASYGKDVTLKFKNLGSKVRVALYETVPGYAVKNVVFYTVDGTTTFSDTKSSEGAVLISTSKKNFPTNGKIAVSFPNVGKQNESNTQNYNKAAATVTPVTASSLTYKTFGELNNFAESPEGHEATGNYLGRTLPTATFAGKAAGSFLSTVDAKYYTTVFPVSDSDPLTLRVNYTLVSTDGSGEEITVLGAKAVVPSKFTVWQPNYAYTYVFKISDTTNGWTDPAGVVSGLFPITFDALVTEATDVTGEQTTITTVSTPSITTYQQGHNPNTNGEFTPADEYSNDGANVYVQVMNGSTLVGNLNTNTSDGTNRSLLYHVDDDDATEAMVMDALQKRTTDINADASVIGRNKITLTKKTINNEAQTIVNGVDNNPITVTKGTAAEITVSSLTEGTYAYVYDYTTGSKTTVDEYQPIDVKEYSDKVGTSGTTYYSETVEALNTLAETSSNFTTGSEVRGTTPDFDSNIYFSVTKNGTDNTTYSYYSIAGKSTLPAGLLKVAKATISTQTVSGGTTAAASTFYFDHYISNNGDYAIKVIKIKD